jgi:hypothetical protein
MEKWRFKRLTGWARGDRKRTEPSNDPKLSRRTCSPRYRLQSCRGKSAGVTKRPRERPPTRNPVCPIRQPFTSLCRGAGVTYLVDHEGGGALIRLEVDAWRQRHHADFQQPATERLGHVACLKDHERHPPHSERQKSLFAVGPSSSARAKSVCYHGLPAMDTLSRVVWSERIGFGTCTLFPYPPIRTRGRRDVGRESEEASPTMADGGGGMEAMRGWGGGGTPAGT